MVELLGSRLMRTTRAPQAAAWWRRRRRGGMFALSRARRSSVYSSRSGGSSSNPTCCSSVMRASRRRSGRRRFLPCAWSARWPISTPARPTSTRRSSTASAAEVNAQNPDVVLLLGDYVIQRVLFGTPMRPETIAAHLGGLRATHGVFAVLGNHDWYDDGKRVWRAFESVGIPVLENRAVPLPGSDDRIWLAGIADNSSTASRSGRNLSTHSRGSGRRGAHARPGRLPRHTGTGGA